MEQDQVIGTGYGRDEIEARVAEQDQVIGTGYGRDEVEARVAEQDQVIGTGYGRDAVEARVAEIGVSRDWVYLPQGRYPLRGSRWAVNDQLHETTQIPSYAIVLAVVFVAFFLLGLLFLLIKERTVQGVVQIRVEGDGFSHATQVPVTSYAAARAVHSRVNRIRRLAVAEAPLESWEP